jgi:exodeoxyribonuclease VII large subunit
MSKPAKSQWNFGELFSPEQTRRVISVSELTTQVKRLLEKQIGSVWVSGEISNFRLQGSSGHIYFTLKDAGAQLACVLFRQETVAHRDLMQDGQKVLIQGDVTVYEASVRCNSSSSNSRSSLPRKVCSRRNGSGHCRAIPSASGW